VQLLAREHLSLTLIDFILVVTNANTE
jgi:hypothetical protein